MHQYCVQIECDYRQEMRDNINLVDANVEDDETKTNLQLVLSLNLYLSDHITDHKNACGCSLVPILKEIF